MGLSKVGPQSEYILFEFRNVHPVSLNNIFVWNCSQQYLCMKFLYAALKYKIIQIDDSAGCSVMLKSWGFIGGGFIGL